MHIYVDIYIDTHQHKYKDTDILRKNQGKPEENSRKIQENPRKNPREDFRKTKG